MTAPVASTRVTPGGIFLEDGYRSLITFSADTDLELYERSIKPPGIEGGEPIDTTTMWNTTLRTASPRSLATMTAGSVSCAYDPIMYTRAISMVNVEQTITITFPEGTTLAFYGYMKSFEPDNLEEGTFPVATVTFVPTNADPTTGDEEDPVLTNVAGT